MSATSAKRPIPRIDQPVPGFYQTRLVRKGVWVPVRIWFDYPPDPDNPGQLLDRSPRWQALLCGSPVDDILDLWTHCCGQPIEESEYRYLMDRGKWTTRYVPGHPAANPERPIDLNAIPPLF